jgi:hypothetical protein
MDRPKAYLCLVWLVGVVSAQTGQQGLTRPTPAVLVTPATNRAQLEPVILTRASLDEKVITLRLAPRVATSIRMPEPVNSVVVGDPENFQAEHSEHEPELVTVKPVAPQPAQTNLLITTTLGHQANLLLISFGEQNGPTQTVDVLLKYGKPAAGSFLVEESPFSPSFIAETQKLDVHAKGLDVASGSPTTVQLAGLMKAASFDPPRAIDGKSSEVLDRLLDRQKRAPLPVLYGQRPGEIEPGPRIKAGVSEVLDEGNEVVVLFSAVNPSSHAIEILPPQVQLGGKVKKKWTTAEQLRVIDFRLSTRRLGAGQRTDGVVIFERPNFKQSSETLFLQVADSGAVDLPALAPIGFGISSFRGGSAYEAR